MNRLSAALLRGAPAQIEAGATQFLAKPVDAGLLLGAVERALKGG